MKKLVLVTWKGKENFGTCLQAYALYKELQDLNYVVTFLSEGQNHYKLKHLIKGILTYLGFKRLKDLKTQNKQLSKIDKFHKKVYKREVKLYTRWQERRLVAKTDCFISGSDQIWNTYNYFSPFYFLAFAEDKKRIAYASSIGTNCIKDEYKNEVKKLLSKYQHIAVREDEAVKVLSKLTGRTDIRSVVDPTFLLSPSAWYDMSKDAIIEEQLPNRYLLCYLIGKNRKYFDQFDDVQKKIGIKDIIIIPAAADNPDFSYKGATIYKKASPYEFVYLIQRATFVCTDSFHATALCINHSIPFVEFLRFEDSNKTSQNSRIYDLLSHYNLMDRIYDRSSSLWETSIDFQTIQCTLKTDRQSSIDYLVTAIET